MRFTSLLVSALLAPLATLAAPVSSDSAAVAFAERQNRPPKPKPCVRMVPDPEPVVYKERFGQFAEAFIYKKNVSRAFEFITQDYIVRLASNHLLSSSCIRKPRRLC
jgi:hypothetical protein